MKSSFSFKKSLFAVMMAVALMMSFGASAFAAESAPVTQAEETPYVVSDEFDHYYHSEQDLGTRQETVRTGNYQVNRQWVSTGPNGQGYWYTWYVYEYKVTQYHDVRIINENWWKRTWSDGSYDIYLHDYSNYVNSTVTNVYYYWS